MKLGFVTVFLVNSVAAYVASSQRAFIKRASPLVEKDLSSGRTPEKFVSLDFTSDPQQEIDIETAEHDHSMPWKSSINPASEGELLYMPFWEWQLSFMKETLTDVRVLSCSDGETDFAYNENLDKKARIVNLSVSSKEYRKIRMTYYDAGDGTQVFNSVWYPDTKYNLPILGLDILAFNKKKYLAIVDFQPLHEEEGDHAAKYEHILHPIKEKYESLKGKMTSKFYDETQFFSQELLFSRFDDENIIEKELMPAFQEYVKAHMDLIRNTECNSDERAFVMQRQKEYDTYSAERDPATAFFAAMFGDKWADDFVHNFLFSLSERPTSTENAGESKSQGKKDRQANGTQR